ncbi:kelch-like protein 42 isoform X2 [Dunckerocampus dactyliophorus]|uniref:kelch-like protein 42 isoform X2 n=1 Tax=Dunckerocampus dactyliophorus TaxID=161453 RepID=UPI00240505AD|nr:kelch-like protein 42 isoform X2 [Dunckerocampus dactyliophorus]
MTINGLLLSGAMQIKPNKGLVTPGNTTYSNMTSDQITTIVLENKIFEVNKKKLMEKSDYFHALYSSGMRESTEDTVQLQGLSVPGLELVLDFINTSKVEFANETLEDLVDAASYLQVTSILKLLTSVEICLDNCMKLYSLSEVHGMKDLHHACLKYMSCHYHPVMRRPEFSSLPSTVRDQMREMRMRGTATLVAIRNSKTHRENECNPYKAIIRYEEVDRYWRPLATNLPEDLINVREYACAVLDNYLFIAGGVRGTNKTLKEMSAVHCYNPCTNEWNQTAPLHQARCEFKLLAVQGNLYAVGGRSLGTVECYNPVNDVWTCVASMPDPLVKFSACECQGMIYVIGGYTTRDEKAKLLRYCPTSDTWMTVELCSMYACEMHSVEDIIYLVGGYETTKPMTRWKNLWQLHHPDPMNAVAMGSYNITTGEWLHMVKRPNQSPMSTLHNNSIYIISQQFNSHDRFNCSHFLKYNIFFNTWETFRCFRDLDEIRLLCSLYLPNDMEH